MVESVIRHIKVKNNKEYNIGEVKLKSRFFAAPMAGITNAPYRRLLAGYGASLVYTEMVSAKGLYYDDSKTENLLFMYEDEGPVGIQIFGHEPEIMAYAARKLEKRKNVILDINMGCPVPKIVKNGDGAALLKDPDRIYSIVRATVNATSKPVTCKIRLGFGEGDFVAPACAAACEAGGARAVCVHGRTREQYYSGQADWEKIAEVKKSVSIPVIANGDVDSVSSALAILEKTGCDFAMIGRACIGNPWIFSQIEKTIDGKNLVDISPEEKSETIKSHLNDLCELKGEHTAIREMRKFIGYYFRGERGVSHLRGAINQIQTLEEMLKAIDDYVLSL